MNEHTSDTGIQISTITANNLSSIAVYRSSFGNVGNLAEKLLKIISKNKCVLIVGDFNICSKKKPQNMITSILQSKDFLSLIDKATHIQGGYIDQAYWKDEDKYFMPPTFQRYSPYYSDHDALCITLTKKESNRRH